MIVMKFIFAMVLSFMPGIINLFWLPDGVTSDWYLNLSKFPLTPNMEFFGFLWTIMHIMLGWALFMVIKGNEETPNNNTAVGLFLLNIVLSAIWPFILFKYHVVIISTVNAIALIAVAYFMRKKFSNEDKFAGYIVWIYILWLIYTLYFNMGLLVLN